MKQLYSTSYNLLPNSSGNSPISNQLSKLQKNNRNLNYPISYSYKYFDYKVQQKTELNRYFPYHMFNKFSVSYDNNFTNKKMDFSFQLKKIDTSIKESENNLQKIFLDDINEYRQRLKYGSNFFIKFAKLKKDKLANKIKKRLSENKNEQIKHRFLKNMFKSKKSKKYNFFDLIIRETEINNVPSSPQKKKLTEINENSKSQHKENKILSYNTLPVYITEGNTNTLNKTIFFKREEISQKNINKPFGKIMNSSRDKSKFRKNDIYSSRVISYAKVKKQKYDLSKLKFPYFPEIVGKRYLYKLGSSKKFNGAK